MTEATETVPGTPGAEVAVRAATRSSPMQAKIQYAKALAESGLLPAAYRKQPANVLYAVEYGEMLGLPPMAAITGIHIIEGKPTASAGLISALVRRAGHKLRVDGDDKTATAQIVRADDPGFTFTATWTLQRAKTAGLLGKGTWEKYPAAMLKARAITEVARDACEEALLGMCYTPEELGADVDEDGNIVGGSIVDEPAPASPAAAPPAPSAAPAAPAASTLPEPGSRKTQRRRTIDPDDPWATTPPGDGWLADACARAASLPDEQAARALWAEAKARADAGQLTAADSKPLRDLIRARVEDLKTAAAEPADDDDVVEGVVVDGPPDTGGLPPEDPWAGKVAWVTSDEDAETAIADVNASKAMTRQRKDQVIAAIRVRQQNLKEGRP